jgi:hypothetical protein
VLVPYTNEDFEYLLGDPSYLGGKMFVMHQFQKHKLALGHDVDKVSVFNKMHANFKVKVEWGIGGLNNANGGD